MLLKFFHEYCVLVFQSFFFKSCPCHKNKYWRRKVYYQKHMTTIDLSRETSVCLYLNINQLDARNFYNEFISCLYTFRAPCAHRQEVKIVLYSLWYHHTETSDWSKITKITKIQFCNCWLMNRALCMNYFITPVHYFNTLKLVKHLKHFYMFRHNDVIIRE